MQAQIDKIDTTLGGIQYTLDVKMADLQCLMTKRVTQDQLDFCIKQAIEKHELSSTEKLNKKFSESVQKIDDVKQRTQQ